MEKAGFAAKFCKFAGTVVLAVSGYNLGIVTRMRKDFLVTMKANGVSSGRLHELKVPGAFELPQALQIYASAQETPHVSVMVALGCVIRGETNHFAIVGENSARGVMLVSLQTRIPVINGILTCDNMRQAEERAREKGAEFACAASQMAAIRESFMPAIPRYCLD